MTERADDLLQRVAETAGKRLGMTAEQLMYWMAIGDERHPDAPADVCGITDPRNDAKWCALGPEHPGEGHNSFAPQDGCWTWTECDAHGNYPGFRGGVS